MLEIQKNLKNIRKQTSKNLAVKRKFLKNIIKFFENFFKFNKIITDLVKNLKIFNEILQRIFKRIEEK